MRRFILLAIPLLILTMAVFHFAVEMLGFQVDTSELSYSDGIDLPGYVQLATWGLEALALTALFVLVHSRNGGWTSGLLSGWIAWVFRGPLLVVTVVGLAGLPPRPWWSVTFSWWILYTLCGLLLSGVAAGVGLGIEPRVPPEPVPIRQPAPEPPPPEPEPIDRVEQE